MHAVRRSISIVLALCVAGLAAMWVAPPAQAVDVNAIGCVHVDYRVPVGSTVTFALPSGCDFATAWAQSGSPSFPSSFVEGPGTIVVGINGPSDWLHMYLSSPYTETFVFACGVDIGTESPDYTIADYCLPDAAGAPPDVLQQVGAPADGDCSAFRDASLDWSGVGSGGWGRSWAQWVNEGRGGAVCTRTLTYSTNAGHFVVAQVD